MDLENREDLRHTIIKEASNLFIKQGYTKTTIRQIADVCGLGRGHLYYYFKKKEDIVLYLYKNLIEQIYFYINKTNKADLDPLLNYAIIQAVYIKLITKNQVLFRIYIEASEIESIRCAYITILREILDEKTKDTIYCFSEKNINTSLIISSAGENELLRQFYNDDKSLDLDEIIEATIKTRLCLLDIDQHKVKDIIDNCKKEVEKKDIKEIEINININTLDI